MAETPTYSYLDILRYLQYKMSSQEMHEFEKALMNDPFLADTLEGFSASDNSLVKQHLTDIEKAITREPKEARVVPLVTQKTAWWKVAVLIFVIVFTGAITYSILNNNSGGIKSNKEIAATKPQAVEIEKDSIRTVEKPTVSVNTFTRNHASTNKKIRSGDIRQTIDTPLNGSKAELAEMYKKETAESLSTSSLAVIVPKANDLVRSSQQLQLRSLIKENDLGDKSNEPLENIKANKKISTADVRRDFLLKTRDSADKTTKATSNASNNKTLPKEDELSLSEIVITEMRNKNKNLELVITIDSANSAEPLGGLKNYQQYLRNQPDFKKGLESFRDVDNKIIVQFFTDNYGHPINVQVPPEIDKTMAEKMIEIISKGPLWKNKQKDKKVKVIIEF